jgi:hypothetical protein
MIGHMDQIVAGTNVRVVWRADIDPRDTSPLWASVRIVDDPWQEQPAPIRSRVRDRVEIEVFAAPPRRNQPKPYGAAGYTERGRWSR